MLPSDDMRTQEHRETQQLSAADSCKAGIYSMTQTAKAQDFCCVCLTLERHLPLAAQAPFNPC
jgi:hypothetical protein